mgnify:CR=1 FL=1
MKSTSRITCSPSLALAEVTRTASGIPKASTSEWISTPHLCNHIQPHLLPLCQGEKEPSTLATYQLISPCHWASESIPCFRRSRVPFWLQILSQRWESNGLPTVLPEVDHTSANQWSECRESNSAPDVGQMAVSLDLASQVMGRRGVGVSSIACRSTLRIFLTISNSLAKSF